MKTSQMETPQSDVVRNQAGLRPTQTRRTEVAAFEAWQRDRAIAGQQVRRLTKAELLDRLARV